MSPLTVSAQPHERWHPDDPVAGSHFFRWCEFAVSAAHPELVEPVPDAYAGSVEQLVRTILDPMRALLARAITVLSCYRSARLNAAVGGSPTSQHRRAEAADIECGNERAVLRAMLLREPRYPTGQVIGYPHQGFLHVALPGSRYPRPSFFVCRTSGTYEAVHTEADLDRLWPAPASG